MTLSADDHSITEYMLHEDLMLALLFVVRLDPGFEDVQSAALESVTKVAGSYVRVQDSENALAA